MAELKDFLQKLRSQHGTQTEVASKIGISSQLLGQYERGERNPKLPFFRKWKEVYNEDLQSLMDEAKVSIKAINNTPVDKPSDNKETSEEVYRNIVEGNTEYILIPRSVLQEKYRLVALEQFQKDKDQMDKDKAVIDRLLSMNERLIAEVTSLQAKIPEVQKA